MKPGAEFTANSCQNRWQRYPKPLWNAGVGCRKSLVGGPRRATESHDASNDLAQLPHFGKNRIDFRPIHCRKSLIAKEGALPMAM